MLIREIQAKDHCLTDCRQIQVMMMLFVYFAHPFLPLLV